MDELLLKKLMLMAKIELPQEAQKVMLADLSRICEWIEQLDKVDTTGVEPLTTLTIEEPILREDVAYPSLNHKKALATSMYSDSNYFSVPNLK